MMCLGRRHIFPSALRNQQGETYPVVSLGPPLMYLPIYEFLEDRIHILIIFACEKALNTHFPLIPSLQAGTAPSKCSREVASMAVTHYGEHWGQTGWASSFAGASQCPQSRGPRQARSYNATA